MFSQLVASIDTSVLILIMGFILIMAGTLFALNPNETFKTADGLGSDKRVWPLTIQPKKFGMGTGTLKKLTPVAFNISTKAWALWSHATTEVSTITSNATPATAGNFTLTVEGETTGNIAYNATAADVQAALRNLGGIEPEDVTAVATTGANLGAASAVVTLNWGGKFKGRNPVISITTTGLTGNAHVLAEATAGEATNETHIIRGFIYPDSVVLDVDEEVLGNVMLEGKLHFDDIVLPTGETAANLKDACRSGLRERGLIVQGLTEFR